VCEEELLLDQSEWREFEARLRTAFDRRDGLDFEVTLLRLRNAITYVHDFANDVGVLTQ
jgi:hypothetical protein